eukprot:TRINITY_DN1236_c0_g1_i1.p1 TRINITY_DN1236_c0_g1~~TRINITY_DN1236_c0_g1_i1.p1  ORF type:complete len:480 (+),score=99.63 TRINITY_DN1236_c0_g1_i1:113-1552(+)
MLAAVDGIPSVAVFGVEEEKVTGRDFVRGDDEVTEEEEEMEVVEGGEEEELEEEEEEEDEEEAASLQRQTLGLPQELLFHILLQLNPLVRSSCCSVASVWNQVVQQTWSPYGSVRRSLEFHSLTSGKILRQCVPHATWTIPLAVELPPHAKIISPCFTQGELSGHTMKCRFVISYCDDGDFEVAIELIKPLTEPLPVTVFLRLENPAHYASWGIAKTEAITIYPGERMSLRMLKFSSKFFRSYKDGFLHPPNYEDIQIKGFILCSNYSYVTVFTEENCFKHNGVDLFNSEGCTTVCLKPSWSNSATFKEDLQEALRDKSSGHFFDDKEFWRIIMRRNHTFRPVSNLMKTYKENFYAVLALTMNPTEVGRECVFVKYFDGSSLSYLGRLMLSPKTQIGDLLDSFKEMAHLSPEDNIHLFEEVHSRRLDPITGMDRALLDMDISSGDIFVISLADVDPFPYYKSLVYSFPLIKIRPYMWHS